MKRTVEDELADILTDLVYPLRQEIASAKQHSNVNRAEVRARIHYYPEYKRLMLLLGNVYYKGRNK